MAVPLVVADRVEDEIARGVRGVDEPSILSADDLEGTEVPIVAGPVDSEVFARVDRDRDGPWIALELGGVGGRSLAGVPASIAILSSAGPCYTCLRRRVTIHHGTEGESPRLPDSSTISMAGGWAAWRRTQTLAGTGSAAIGTISEFDGPTRVCLPIPNCACTPYDPSTPETISFDTQSLDQTLDRAERAVDDRLGLITEVGEQASHPAPYYVAQLAETDSISDASAPSFAAGVDLDWNAAFMRAVGEALERYSAAIYDASSLPQSPPHSSIDLDRFPIATDGATATGGWWPGRTISSAEPVSLPMEVVVFPPPEAADIDPITTGLGLDSSLGGAIVRGVLEVIERDAAMLAWYSTFDPVELTVDDQTYRSLRRRVAGEGLAVTSVLVTQDLDVPVVTSVLHRRDASGTPVLEIPSVSPDDWPAFAVGSAADLDPAHAAVRSLSEAIQNWTELAEMGPERAAEEGPIGDFGTFPRSARSLISTDTEVDASAIAPDPIPKGQEALAYLRDELAASGLDAYVARVTPPDVAELGFEAVRILVPDAQPLVRSGAPFTERARTVPNELGFRPRLDAGPHPYP